MAAKPPRSSKSFWRPDATHNETPCRHMQQKLMAVCTTERLGLTSAHKSNKIG